MKETERVEVDQRARNWYSSHEVSDVSERIAEVFHGSERRAFILDLKERTACRSSMVVVVVVVVVGVVVVVVNVAPLHGAV